MGVEAFDGHPLPLGGIVCPVFSLDNFPVQVQTVEELVQGPSVTAALLGFPGLPSNVIEGREQIGEGELVILRGDFQKFFEFGVFDGDRESGLLFRCQGEEAVGGERIGF